MSADANAADRLLDMPPLPKALITIADATNSQWDDHARVYAAQMAMSKEEERKDVKTSHTDLSLKTDQEKSLSAALATLHKEMAALRLQDGSLLCQLMSLSQSLAELRAQEEQYQMLSESSDMILEEDFEEDVDCGVITNGTISII